MVFCYALFLVLWFYRLGVRPHPQPFSRREKGVLPSPEGEGPRVRGHKTNLHKITTKQNTALLQFVEY